MSQHLRNLTDWEPSVQAQVVVPVAGTNHVKSYNVIIKRNDRLYRILSAINTATLVCGVILIAATFAMVAYGLFVTMNTNEVLEIMRQQRK